MAANHELAKSLFTKAAMEGHGTAQLFLGRMYLRGEGGPKDNKKAYYWLSIAATQEPGDAELLLNRARVSKFGIEIGTVTLAFFKLPQAAAGQDGARVAARSSETVPMLRRAAAR